MTGQRFGELRDTLRAAAQDFGLRAVAREVGISAQSVANFVSGTTRPAPDTVEKLRRWDFRQKLGGGSAQQPDREAVRIAIEALTAPIAPERRQAATRRLLAVTCDQWRAAGVPVPGWAEELKDPPRAFVDGKCAGGEGGRYLVAGRNDTGEGAEVK